MFNLVNKKEVYDSVITRKENASKDWNFIISLFPTSFNQARNQGGEAPPTKS